MSFDVDMIGIGLQRFKLNIPPNNYAAKFKRIRFKSDFEPRSKSDWVFEVLMPGWYGFPNVKYAEIDVFWLGRKLPRWARSLKVPVNKLVCGSEKMVCFGGDGEIMTLKQVMWNYCEFSDELLEYFSRDPKVRAMYPNIDILVLRLRSNELM